MKPIVPVKADVEAMVARDQWDRPKILPPGGGDPVAYRRASTVAEVLPDHWGLGEWKTRLTAEGLAKRPDLANAYLTASKAERRDILEQAFEFAGGSISARNGSTMHALTDRIDNGLDIPDNLPPHIRAMLDKYREATARFTVLDSERFVVQDKIKVAGTYDRRLADDETGRVFIGDLKTGQNLAYQAITTPAQVAVYAAGKHYDLDGEREEHGAERDTGILIWLPWTEDPSEAFCEVRTLDLVWGRKCIKQAMAVEKTRKVTYNQVMPHLR